MDFSLSEEQQLLKDSVDRFVRDNYELPQRNEVVASDGGFGAQHWKTMAELGWLGAALPEEYGGIGGGPVETMVIMEGFGRGLVVEPYLASVVLGGNLLLTGASEATKGEFLPKLADGTLHLAFAFAEPQSRFDLFDVETTAKKDGDGFLINGQKGVVIHGGSADRIIVSARTAGSGRDEKGVSLFLVDANADGVSRRNYQTIDGLRAAEVTFANVAVPAAALIGDVDNAMPLIDDTIRRGIAAVSAEAVGIMDTMQSLTNDYLKTREQFGRPLGKFQALQHRMVDILIACEESRSAMIVATLCLDESDAVKRDKAVTAAKVKVGQHGTFVGQNAIQLHGGMGMTDEMHISHYFKRLAMIDTVFGDHSHHLKRFMAL
ncbi:MAG: acyl-CoA dehydrogenase family protein [Pseudomonadota bacterium]